MLVILSVVKAVNEYLLLLLLILKTMSRLSWITRDQLIILMLPNIFMNTLSIRLCGISNVRLMMLIQYLTAVLEALCCRVGSCYHSLVQLLFLQMAITSHSRKHTTITPIPKVDPPTSFSDIRPISIMPIMSRIFDGLFVGLHLALRCPSFYFGSVCISRNGTRLLRWLAFFYKAASVMEHCD